MGPATADRQSLPFWSLGNCMPLSRLSGRNRMRVGAARHVNGDGRRANSPVPGHDIDLLRGTQSSKLSLAANNFRLPAFGTIFKEATMRQVQGDKPVFRVELAKLCCMVCGIHYARPQ